VGAGGSQGFRRRPGNSNNSSRADPPAAPAFFALGSKSSAGAHFLEALATCRSFPGLPQGEPARSEACHDLQCHFDSSKSKAKGVPYWYNKRNGGTTWN
jgi:hypothetical protein